MITISVLNETRKKRLPSNPDIVAANQDCKNHGCRSYSYYQNRRNQITRNAAETKNIATSSTKSDVKQTGQECNERNGSSSQDRKSSNQEASSSAVVETQSINEMQELSELTQQSTTMETDEESVGTSGVKGNRSVKRKAETCVPAEQPTEEKKSKHSRDTTSTASQSCSSALKVFFDFFRFFVLYDGMLMIYDLPYAFIVERSFSDFSAQVNGDECFKPSATVSMKSLADRTVRDFVIALDKWTERKCATCNIRLTSFTLSEQQAQLCCEICNALMISQQDMSLASESVINKRGHGRAGRRRKQASSFGRNRNRDDSGENTQFSKAVDTENHDCCQLSARTQEHSDSEVLEILEHDGGDSKMQAQKSRKDIEAVYTLQMDEDNGAVQSQEVNQLDKTLRTQEVSGNSESLQAHNENNETVCSGLKSTENPSSNMEEAVKRSDEVEVSEEHGTIKEESPLHAVTPPYYSNDCAVNDLMMNKNFNAGIPAEYLMTEENLLRQDELASSTSSLCGMQSSYLKEAQTVSVSNVPLEPKMKTEPWLPSIASLDLQSQQLPIATTAPTVTTAITEAEADMETRTVTTTTNASESVISIGTEAGVVTSSQFQDLTQFVTFVIYEMEQIIRLNQLQISGAQPFGLTFAPPSQLSTINYNMPQQNNPLFVQPIRPSAFVPTVPNQSAQPIYGGGSQFQAGWEGALQNLTYYNTTNSAVPYNPVFNGTLFTPSYANQQQLLLQPGTFWQSSFQAQNNLELTQHNLRNIHCCCSHANTVNVPQIHTTFGHQLIPSEQSLRMPMHGMVPGLQGNSQEAQNFQNLLSHLSLIPRTLFSLFPHGTSRN
ncbi:unnamed protein product [Thelazia callipaeda]|uniref:ULP_PROTEASE domain-containing protein n=1 Tax=Thelazia callipaeda TaxID=103827 RepID=A0A158RCA4_THECL|nr:unnamed protein product [Thelazia callipaeda]